MTSRLSHGGSRDPTMDSTPGPYILRSLLNDIALSEDGDEDVHITCVEFWNDNLYIGTSAAELLHYVLIPADPGDPTQDPTFILASRLQPSYTGSAPVTDHGVQQILILPQAGKASILCNGTATFYSLPELSPAYSSSTKIRDCSWIGGVDLNGSEDDEEDGTLIMVCQKTRIRLVRIGEKPKTLREVLLPGIVATVRRGDIACAANPQSYSLIDVMEKQSIPLFDISSVPAPVPSIEVEETISTPEAATETLQAVVAEPGHQAGGSNSDLEKSDSSLGSVQAENPQTQKELPELPPEPGAEADASKPAEESPSSAPAEASEPTQSATKTTSDASSRPLRPYVLSPSSDRFLLTMGTSYSEPGIGMFVNLDGDVVPPSLEFSRYPLAVAIDGDDISVSSSPSGGDLDQSYIFAVVDKARGAARHLVLEIQSCDLSPAATLSEKHTLNIPTKSSGTPIKYLGLRSALSSKDYVLSEVVQILRLSNVQLQSLASRQTGKTNPKVIQTREQGALEFAARLSQVNCKTLVWGQRSIWSAARTPLVLRLNATLETALHEAYGNSSGVVNRDLVERAFNDLRYTDPRTQKLHNKEPQTELDFISFSYIRQKASLLLFISLASQTYNGIMTYDRDRVLAEQALESGEIDPRVILALLPKLRHEIITDVSGVWIPLGLIEVVQSSLGERQRLGDSDEATTPFLASMFPLVKHYLQFWRAKKGFGSIEDEENLFKSVDAALLHILLILDQDTSPGPATEGSIRQELNALVDKGLDCFERAVELLEQFQRLYVLSRLYQGRKKPSLVLATWQRILDGETDRGGEFTDGESGVRRYLSQVKDKEIVEQYGAWLAKRNPQLGVRVFTQDNGRVKFTPEEAVNLLKEEAPEAVQHLLEHLVFGKHLPKYANDLIGYYLDSVLAELDNHEESRQSLRESYRAYRALRPPKPTYSQFIADNPMDSDWWRNRLRLLQLLGGSDDVASQYNVPAMLKRIEPYKDELVPEMIILGGRQGRHRDAIRLLTHGLSDYDTAIRYCVRGGSGTYSTMASGAAGDSVPTHTEQRELFDDLLLEFFRIEDISDRVTQTSALLERFSGWFDVSHVIESVPDDWSVDLLSGFLESAFRELVSDRHETAIAKALTSAQNLQANAGLVEKLDGFDAVVDHAKGDQDTTA